MTGKALFITGTDTNVGKTVVSAMITLGSNGRYWKPIQSGTDPVTDTAWVRNTTELSEDHFFTERYVLSKPLSPHAAAEIDGISILKEKITMPPFNDNKLLVIEGAGGLFVPINKHEFVIDIIKEFAQPVVLVARSGLGTINHTLLSLRLLRQFDIAVIGVILNGDRNQSNKEAIEWYGKTKVVAELEPLANLDKKTLNQSFNENLRPFVEDFMHK